MPRYPLRNFSKAQLRRAAQPAVAADVENYPSVIFDTQTYVDTATTQLTFFAAAQNNANLSNMPQANTLPIGHFLQLQYIYVDYIDASAFVSTAAAVGGAGSLNDVGLLHIGGNAILNLLINGKPYGPWPLQRFRGCGSVQGGGWGWGTIAAGESVQFGTNMVTPDGGPCFAGLMIPEQTSFQVVITWAAAQNTAGGDYLVRVSLDGEYSRPVR